MIDLYKLESDTKQKLEYQEVKRCKPSTTVVVDNVDWGVVPEVVADGVEPNWSILVF